MCDAFIIITFLGFNNIETIFLIFFFLKRFSFIHCVYFCFPSVFTLYRTSVR